MHLTARAEARTFANYLTDTNTIQLTPYTAPTPSTYANTYHSTEHSQTFEFEEETHFESPGSTDLCVWHSASQQPASNLVKILQSDHLSFCLESFKDFISFWIVTYAHIHIHKNIVIFLIYMYIVASMSVHIFMCWHISVNACVYEFFWLLSNFSTCASYPRYWTVGLAMHKYMISKSIYVHIYV